MPWPDDIDLPIEVLAAFGADLTADPATWEFTDLTDRLLSSEIRLRAGRSEGASETSAATGSVVLDNDDGALTPEHAMSEYWPYVDMNTPIWLRLAPEVLADPIVSDAFGRTLTQGWGTADSGQAWETSGVGGSVLAADATVSAGQGRHFVPTTLAYRACWLPDLSLLDPDVTVTVDTVISDVTGASIEPGNILLRMQDVNTWYMARVVIEATEAVSIQLHHSSGILASTALPGLVWTGQPLMVRARILGGELAAKVWDAAASAEPDWQVEATDTQISAAGSIGIRSGVASGNTNTKPVEFRYDNLVVRAYWELLAGFADQWEPTFVPKGDGTFTSAVRLTLSGVLRRLGQGTSPTRSPLYRAYATADPPPIAWYPLEDGKDVDRAASGILGQPPITELGRTRTDWASPSVDGYVVWGVEGSGGAASLVGLAEGGRLLASIPPSTSQAWTFEFVVRYPAKTGTGAGSVPMTITGPNGYEWSFLFQPSGFPNQMAGGINGAVGVVVEWTQDMWDGLLHHVRLVVEQQGADAAHYVVVDGEMAGAAFWFGTDPPMPDRFQPNAYWDTGSREAEVGHLVLFDYADVWDTTRPPAAQAWIGEDAADRIARLCAEEGVRFTAEAGESESMGPQQPKPLLELIRECEAADGGVLYEERWGLGYRPRSARYNLDSSLTIDLSTYQYSQGTSPDAVLAPQFDDARTRNEWTISRPDGSTVTVPDAAHQRRVGRYDDSADINVATDGVLGDHAGWRVHVGTKSSRRYPATPLDLAANPDYLATWLALRPGDRVTRTNLPPQHPPGQIDIINEGHTATLSPRSWQVAISGGPYAPWEIATADGDRRAGADGSTLGAELAGGAMTCLLGSTAANGPWTTDAAAFPLAIRAGGEKVTASAIASSVVDTFTRTASSGWGTSASGHAWTASGGSASDYSVSSNIGRISLGTLNVSRRLLLPGTYGDCEQRIQFAVGAVGVGDDIETTLVARFQDAGNMMQCSHFWDGDSTFSEVRIIRRQAGVATSLTTVTMPFTQLGAGLSAWMRFQCEGSTFRAKVWAANGVEPPTWTTEATDNTWATGQIGVRANLQPGFTGTLPLVVSVDNYALLNPQTVTLSARGVNGITRSWPAGTPVDVWEPAIAPL